MEITSFKHDFGTQSLGRVRKEVLTSYLAYFERFSHPMNTDRLNSTLFAEFRALLEEAPVYFWYRKYSI